jgi:hypothetical protein
MDFELRFDLSLPSVRRFRDPAARPSRKAQKQKGAIPQAGIAPLAIAELLNPLDGFLLPAPAKPLRWYEEDQESFIDSPLSNRCM